MDRHQKQAPSAAHWVNEPVNEPRNLLPVAKFAERWAAWTQPALRNLILNSQDRLNSRGERIAGNGLAVTGAVVRVGRRVLLDEQAFFRWIANQQKRKAP